LAPSFFFVDRSFFPQFFAPLPDEVTACILTFSLYMPFPPPPLPGRCCPHPIFFFFFPPLPPFLLLALFLRDFLVPSDLCHFLFLGTVPLTGQFFIRQYLSFYFFVLVPSGFSHDSSPPRPVHAFVLNQSPFDSHMPRPLSLFPREHPSPSFFFFSVPHQPSAPPGLLLSFCFFAFSSCIHLLCPIFSCNFEILSRPVRFFFSRAFFFFFNLAPPSLNFFSSFSDPIPLLGTTPGSFVFSPFFSPPVRSCFPVPQRQAPFSDHFFPFDSQT